MLIRLRFFRGTFCRDATFAVVLTGKFIGILSTFLLFMGFLSVGESGERLTREKCREKYY